MQLVIRAIIVYRDVWVSAADLWLLKHHFGGQIVKKNSIFIRAASTLMTMAGIAFTSGRRKGNQGRKLSP